MAASRAFVGAAPCCMYGEQQGTWYSHPQQAECAEDQLLGALMPSGAVCSWKQVGELRVLKGWQLLHRGFNYSFSQRLPDSQVRPIVQANAAVFAAAFDAVPLKPFECSTIGTIRESP